MKTKLLLFIPLLTLACATVGKMKNIEPGMTKAEVRDIMGKPKGVSHSGTTDTFTYLLSENSFDQRHGILTPYVFKFDNGVLTEYGRGDVNESALASQRSTATQSDEAYAQRVHEDQLNKQKQQPSTNTHCVTDRNYLGKIETNCN